MGCGEVRLKGEWAGSFVVELVGGKGAMQWAINHNKPHPRIPD